MPGADEVARNLRAYRDSTVAALFALAQQQGMKMEAHAKPNAPWQDRTGDARKGLVGSASQTSTAVLSHIAHSERHGVYLELANQGRYGILKKTRDKFAPEFFRGAERILRGGPP